MCTHNSVLSKNKKKYHIFIAKIIVFTAVKNHRILHRHVCVMLNSMIKLKNFGNFHNNSLN